MSYLRLRFRHLSLALLLQVPLAAVGMDYFWGPAPPGMSQGGGNSYLYLRGEIRVGDSLRFEEFMRQNWRAYLRSPRLVVLSSNGGNLVEALRIANLLKQMYAHTHVIGDRCASSCFFLFLSGTLRFAEPGMLGVHRAYYAQEYFAGLTPSQAQKRQGELTAAVQRSLLNNGVPQYLVDRMNATSSAEMHWLTADDLNRLGMRPAWYEELLIAKCGFDKQLEQQFRSVPEDSERYGAIRAAYVANSRSVAECEAQFAEPELARLGAQLLRGEPKPQNPR